MSDHDTIQALMNQAYEKYDSGMDRIDWFEELDYLERCAVAVGNFNYQVENGGCTQYIDNGYADQGGAFLLRFLTKHQFTEEAKLVRRVLKFNDKIGPKASVFVGDSDWESISQKADAVDTAYYKINKSLLDKVDSILKAKLENTNES